jgi:hypothetical protein
MLQIYSFLGLVSFSVLFFIINTHITYASEISDLIYSKDSNPFGKPYAVWVNQDWWTWHVNQTSKLPSASSDGSGDHPREVYSSNKCSWNQFSKEVHFLPDGNDNKALLKNPEKRLCEVPFGKAILVSIYGGTCNETEGKTYQDRKECAEVGLGKNDRLSVKFYVKFDDILLMDTRNMTSIADNAKKVEKYLPDEIDEYVVTLNEENTYSYPAGPHTTYSIGYAAFLKPPSIGEHTLEVYAEYNDPTLKPPAMRNTHFIYTLNIV